MRLWETKYMHNRDMKQGPAGRLRQTNFNIPAMISTSMCACFQINSPPLMQIKSEDCFQAQKAGQAIYRQFQGCATLPKTPFVWGLEGSEFPQSFFHTLFILSLKNLHILHPWRCAKSFFFHQRKLGQYLIISLSLLPAGSNLGIQQSSFLRFALFVSFNSSCLCFLGSNFLKNFASTTCFLYLYVMNVLSMYCLCRAQKLFCRGQKMALNHLELELQTVVSW